MRKQQEDWQREIEAVKDAKQAAECANEVGNDINSTRRDIEDAEAAAQRAADRSAAAAENVGKTAEASKAAMFMSGGRGAFTVTGRSNDPFTFCTFGVPIDGWIALNPLTGTYQLTRWCPACPNLMWVPVYTKICPLAMSVGPWVGPGTGQQFMAAPTGVAPGLAPYPH